MPLHHETKKEKATHSRKEETSQINMREGLVPSFFKNSMAYPRLFSQKIKLKFS